MGVVPAGERWPLPTAEGGPRLFRPVLPEWVCPAARAVSDCYWLAYRAHIECLAGAPGAVAATLAWVAGGEPSPVTGRREQPVTRVLADVEGFATSGFLSCSTPLPLREVCEVNGLDYRPILAAEHVTAEWAGRVWRTLRWLSDRGPGGRGVAAPIAVPVRNADGSLASADRLYADAVAREPWLYQVMEQKAELRTRVERECIQSEQLDRVVRATKRAAGVAAA